MRRRSEQKVDRLENRVSRNKKSSRVRSNRVSHRDTVSSRSARVRLANILNTAADCLDCLEHAEEGRKTRDTRAARKDLSEIIARLASMTDNMTPQNPNASRELRDIERDLARFPQ